jgi:alpha-1,6-mannosyltransferase
VRIVDVNEFYAPAGGGVRSYLDRKIGILASMGHELIVVAPGREDRVEERPGGGRIHYVRAQRMPFDARYGLFWDAEPITRLLDHYDPDVVECSSPWRPAWIVGQWQAKGPKRALKSFFMHNDNLEAYAMRWFEGVAPRDRIERVFGWYTRYMARFLGLYDTVVTNGPALARRMRGRGLTIDEGIALGIEREHFSPSFRDEGLRAALLAQCGLPEDANLLVAIGRHHAEKRWPVVIDAVERAGAELPIGLVLIGEGMGSKGIERRVAASPHIRLFRPVRDRHQLARIMASADAFLHGNDSETFGLVVSEALACGAPLIVPDIGGASEVARPAFAESFAARDARSGAEAIVRLLTRDRAVLRRAALVAAAKVPSDRDHAEMLVDYYAGAIARRAALAA